MFVLFISQIFSLFIFHINCSIYYFDLFIFKLFDLFIFKLFDLLIFIAAKLEDEELLLQVKIQDGKVSPVEGLSRRNSIEIPHLSNNVQ